MTIQDSGLRTLDSGLFPALPASTLWNNSPLTPPPRSHVAAICFALIAAAFLFCSGCAFNRQFATTTTANTNGIPTVTVARSTTFALGDAKAIVDKTRATAGKTSSVGATGVNEEASSSGLATNITALVQLLNALK